MSFTSTNAQLSLALNPEAVAFEPRQVVETVEERKEYSIDEMVARWEVLAGFSDQAIHDEEDWMAEMINQDAENANYQMGRSTSALLVMQASVSDTNASNLTQEVTHAEIGANDFNKLPGELRNKIFELALTAENGIISMPCLSNKTFKRNVATALLQTCRQVYVEARKFLYSANTIIFDNFSSDINDIARFAYPWNFKGPTFANITLDIGHMAVDWRGFFGTYFLAYALMGMRNPIKVDNLVLEFRAFCFNETIKPEDLAMALSKIKVRKSLIMCGAGYHWDEEDISAVPRALGMVIDSVNMCPDNEALVDPRPGFFIVKYKPASDCNDPTKAEMKFLDEAKVQGPIGCKIVCS